MQQDIGSSVMTDISGRQQPSPYTWRPIAEAPSDNGWISRSLFAKERKWGWEMWVGQCDDGDIWLGRTGDGSCFDTDKPTHWQPLPASPAATPHHQYSSVRADDHEVGQPSPETRVLELLGQRVMDRRSIDDWCVVHIGFSDPDLALQFHEAISTLSPATVAPDSTPPAVTDETKSSEYLRGERAGLELAARWFAPNFPGQARDMLRALLPPSTPETKS